MRYLFLILFPLLSLGQSQAVINLNDTILPVSQGSIPLTACVSFCGIPSSYKWWNVAGNPVIFSATGGTTTTISGFQVGMSRIGFQVTGTNGKTASDTLNLGFSAPIPPVPPCPPPVVCDSAAIIANYVKNHPCPPVIVCPPIPKQRTVIKRNTTHDGTGKEVDTYTYDDNSNSNL